MLTGIGAIGAMLAYVIGPWLFDLFYRDYAGLAAGTILAALTFASVFMAILVLTGTATLALGKHRLYTTGWVVAAISSAALLFLPLSLEARVLISLYLGPCIGFCVHLTGIHRSSNDRSKTPATARS
ncbi:hypothetical protein NBM05_04075 [Rothia sp. AR01]|uniref:Uncharacterized protein n=1 Tax=Rothia santali TaxID=2949643 RepID=A0A9X2HDK1_9MICC|nr:hypothetical protein [Rothia santali]MCP3425224.1 hypothetical protein [Rothia santali]